MEGTPGSVKTGEGTAVHPIRALKKIFSRRRRRKQKKIFAVALGCGGAKGMAHLGVLQALEEEGIFFDWYAGTSIGSVVGALKAYGYATDEIKDAVLNICLKQYARYLRPYMDMGFVEDVLNGYLHDIDFKRLKAPFYAWATDKETVEGVLLDSGSVAHACTASCAIPPYFHSVNVSGRELIDGVYTNPVPADVLRVRGADFVLGVDLNAALPSDRNKKPHNMLTRVLSDTLDSTVKITPRPDALSRGYEACNAVIRPPLDIFTPLDAAENSLLEMYDIGYRTAKQQAAFIKRKIREIY